MKNMYIVCKDSGTKGIINFYVEGENGSYFLFQQRFRRSSYDFYKNGVPVREAFSHKKVHKDNAIQKVISRLPSAIAYAEKEYDIVVLNKTNKKVA